MNQSVHKQSQIIIADDDPSVRFLLKHILEKDHYRTIDAANGREVLAILEKNSVDMILLDAVMPELNGFEACRLIKQNHPGLPVIIITSLDDDSSVEEAFDSGADDYVTKPINWSVLKHRISRAQNNTPESILKEASFLAYEIETQDYNIVPRARIDVETEKLSSINVQFHHPENRNKRLLKPETALQLTHAKQLIEQSCRVLNRHPDCDHIGLYIQPFNANPVQYVTMLKETFRSERIDQQNIECIFHESQIHRQDIQHLYNAISEMNVKMHIEKFSFSLHSLNLVKSSRCDAIEIDIPLIFNTLGNVDSTRSMLQLYIDKNVKIIGADVSTPKEYDFAVKIGCKEVHGPAIGNEHLENNS